MKKNRLLLLCLCICFSPSIFAQDFFNDFVINGTYTATGDITIHNGATVTMAEDATLLMPPGSELFIRDGGNFVVKARCTIRSTNNGYWQGIIIEPTSIANPDNSPAVIMAGGPYTQPENRIDFQDAIDAFYSLGNPDHSTQLRGFRLHYVDFTHCKDFFDYASSSSVQSSINSGIHSCTFTADSNTDPVSLFFSRISDLNISASTFTQPFPNNIGGYWFIMMDFTDNIYFGRNHIINDGIALGFTFNNVEITHNRILNPRRHGIALQAFPSSGGGNNVRVYQNWIDGGNSSEQAIQARDIDNLRIELNTVNDRQRGIWCFRIGGNSLVANNSVSNCTQAGIIIRGDNTGDEMEDGLLLKCNTLTNNATAIQIDLNGELPVHLTQWGSYTIETDPGNKYINNGLDINNDNIGFSWLYYVLDVSNTWLNPPVTTNGLVNLVNLQMKVVMLVVKKRHRNQIKKLVLAMAI